MATAHITANNMESTVNEIQLSYTRKILHIDPIRASHTAFKSALFAFSQTHSELDLKEYMFVLLVNQSNHLTGYYKLSEGGISQTTADIRICFAVALKSLATGIILAHNHPSGNIKPSQADINLTKQFKEAGKLLSIPLLDHLIITGESYYSLADEGFI